MRYELATQQDLALSALWADDDSFQVKRVKLPWLDSLSLPAYCLGYR